MRLVLGRNMVMPPLFTAEALSNRLLYSTVVIMLKLFIPFQIFLVLAIAHNIWVTGTSRPINLVVHIIGAVATFTIAAYLVVRSPAKALASILLISVGIIYIQTLLTNKVQIFSVILPVVGLPALVMRARIMFKFMAAYTAGFLALGLVDPAIFMTEESWPLIVISTCVIILGFMAIGYGFRRVIEDYTQAVEAHKREAVAREREAQLRRAAEEARQFVSFYNHEVGGLISGSLGMLPLLRSDYEQTLREVSGGELTEDQQENLADFCKVESAISQADRIIKEITVLTREGQLARQQYAPLDLPRLLDQARQAAGLIYPAVPIELVVPQQCRLYGDAFLLRLALETLLRNACHSLTTRPVPHPSIRVVVTCAGDTVIRVEDNGCGFSPDLLERLLSYLRDGQSLPVGLSSRPGGTGIGIPLAYKVVSLHRGWIRLGNRSDAPGAWVELHLPAWEE